MSTEDEDTNWIAHSAVVKFADVFNRYRKISGAALIASVVIILAIIMIMTAGSGETKEGKAMISIGIALIVGAGMWVVIGLGLILHWMFVNRKLRGRLLQIRSSFAHRSYVTTFELVRPVGKTKIDRICNHLSLVFPEVQQLKKRLEEPPWYKFWLKKHQKFSDIKKDSTNLADYDLVLYTSTGVILLKIFEKTVTHDDIDQLVHKFKKMNTDKEKSGMFNIFLRTLKNLVQRGRTSEILRKILTDDHMSRVICLADKYEPWFETEDFIEYMEDLTHDLKELKIDLILEDSKGYSTIWIDR